MLTIEVPSETVTAEIENIYEKVRRDATHPGFRKGKVPRKILEKDHISNGYLGIFNVADTDYTCRFGFFPGSVRDNDAGGGSLFPGLFGYVEKHILVNWL